MFPLSRSSTPCQSITDMGKLRPVGQKQHTGLSNLARQTLVQGTVKMSILQTSNVATFRWKFRFIYIIWHSIPHPTNTEPTHWSNCETHFGLWAKRFACVYSIRSFHSVHLRLRNFSCLAFHKMKVQNFNLWLENDHLNATPSQRQCWWKHKTQKINIQYINHKWNPTNQWSCCCKS